MCAPAVGHYHCFEHPLFILGHIAIVQMDKNRAEMEGVFPSTSPGKQRKNHSSPLFSSCPSSSSSEQFCDFGLHGGGPEAAHWKFTVVSRTSLASNILQIRVKMTDVMMKNTETP